MSIKPIYFNLQQLDRYTRYESRGLKPKIGVLNEKYLFVCITEPKLNGIYEKAEVLFWKIVSSLLEKLKYLNFDSAKVILLSDEAKDKKNVLQKRDGEIAKADNRLKEINELITQRTEAAEQAQVRLDKLEESIARHTKFEGSLDKLTNANEELLEVKEKLKDFLASLVPPETV